MKLDAFLVLPAVIVATGCGDSGGQRLSREEYASKADAICLQYGEDTSALRNPLTVSELVTVLDKQLPILEGARRNAATALNPPDERAWPSVDQWLATEDKDQGRIWRSSLLASISHRCGRRTFGQRMGSD